MYFTKHVDWLSITFPTDTNLQALFPLLDWHYVGKGRHGYQFAYQDRLTGAHYQEGSANQAMGVHLTLSGDTLNMLRSQHGGTDDGLVKYLSQSDGSASRIDLTLNLHEATMTVDTLFQAWKQGKLTAKAHNARLIQGMNDGIFGDTFYIGAPKSDRQFRAYNKAAELGIVDGTAWLRLELELRSLRAKAALQSACDNGVASAVTGHMGDFLHWDNREFTSALAAPAAEPYELPRKDTNRRKWLIGVVAQSLAKEIALDVSFERQFASAVQHELDLLNSAN